MHKKIEKMRAAMVACGVAPALIDEVVASVSNSGMFTLPAVQRVGAAEADKFFAERFWPNYPKRAGGNPKEAARKKIVQLVTGGENPEAILDGLRRLVRGLRARQKIGSEFVPMAITWLNRKGWLDDPEPEMPAHQMQPNGGGGGFFAAAAAIRRNAGE